MNLDELNTSGQRKVSFLQRACFSWQNEDGHNDCISHNNPSWQVSGINYPVGYPSWGDFRTTTTTMDAGIHLNTIYVK